MKRLVFFLLLLISSTAFPQKQGIGLRLGDPMGITYKKYLRHTHAVEFGLGTVPAYWHNNYYIHSFNEFLKYDNYRYRNHTVQSSLYLQGRYLFHYTIPVNNMEGKLDSYWGVGALLKTATVQYRYQNKSEPSLYGTDTRNDIDFGPEGIAGLEYTFQDIPLAVFGEASLLMELADRPVTLRVFGGLGVRYIFFRR